MSKKVKAKWIVAVPDGATVKVKIGDKVSEGGCLLETTERCEKMVNVSKILQILSVAERIKLAEKLAGTEVKSNEVVYEKKGMFPKKITFPLSGKIVKIDEFGNLYYQETGNKIKNVTAPVAATVTKSDGKSLELEFTAIEYSGRGINEGRVWGTRGMGYADDITELSVKYTDKIMLTPKLDQAWMSKAEVVGVAGIVVIDDDDAKKGDRINLRLPIIALEKSDWEELKEKANEVNRVLINATGGRLLLEIK